MLITEHNCPSQALRSKRGFPVSTVVNFSVISYSCSKCNALQCTLMAQKCMNHNMVLRVFYL